MIFSVDFCDGCGSLLCKYSVGLDKIYLLFKTWRNQTAKEKYILSDTKNTFFEKGHRQILIKITFLGSAQCQLSNGICHASPMAGLTPASPKLCSCTTLNIPFIHVYLMFFW